MKNLEIMFVPDIARHYEPKNRKTVEPVRMPANGNYGGKIPWNQPYLTFLVDKSLLMGMDIDQAKSDLTKEQRKFIARSVMSDVCGASEEPVGDCDGDIFRA